MIPKMLHSIICNVIRGFESRMILINCGPKVFLNILMYLKSCITKIRDVHADGDIFAQSVEKFTQNHGYLLIFTYFHRYPKEFILAFL